MSGSFVKLFNTITDSSIWALPDHVRIVWITMLAMADKNGDVSASVVGVAGRARKSLEETLDALRILMAPDPYSRTKMAEGRRLEEIDGGWHFITWEHHRQAIAEELHREQKRAWWRENRSVAPESGLTSTSLDELDNKKSSLDSGSISSLRSDLDLDPDLTRARAREVEAADAVIVVNPQRGRIAPADFAPTDTHRVRCKELQLDVDTLLREFKLFEFNRDYSDWNRRFSRWIEDAKIKAETERAKANSRAAFGPGSRFGEGGAPSHATPTPKRLPGLPAWVAEEHANLARDLGLDIKATARSFAKSYHLPVASLRPADVRAPLLEYITRHKRGAAVRASA